ncbi:transglutaminase-like domain-containing protein [Maribacter hydrothermalis]|uniref:Transglutaminase n=1 Tax=Maribacter hydrothermalis TaxID=1836467 RepID=A0A1B7ZDT9_9FLAO|nr:transglutaminase family protein [Maribacter hydrothermalis]APQ16587.1 transglutaminase [Maribacter hydrothermalis]OBR41508.1 transglutaminase [Maribacter hydrothermalis]
MDYLASTYFYDYESDEIQAFILEYKNTLLSKKEIAKQLYTKVRDTWRYDPYSLSFSKEKYRASEIAKRSKGHCIDKSIVLIASLRAMEIPARIHLAKVKNHIGVERLIEKFGSNELTPHGMVDVLLNDKWLKISPTFNASLCTMLNVAPLDFDGENDAILQEFNHEGSQFMEYLEDYGHFEDVPVAFMAQNAREHYPAIFDSGSNETEFKL